MPRSFENGIEAVILKHFQIPNLLLQADTSFRTPKAEICIEFLTGLVPGLQVIRSTESYRRLRVVTGWCQIELHVPLVHSFRLKLRKHFGRGPGITSLRRARAALRGPRALSHLVLHTYLDNSKPFVVSAVHENAWVQVLSGLREEVLYDASLAGLAFGFSTSARGVQMCAGRRAHHEQVVKGKTGLAVVCNPRITTTRFFEGYDCRLVEFVVEVARRLL